MSATVENHSTPPVPTDVNALQDKLKTLTEFSARLRALRQIPAVLVRPPGAGSIHTVAPSPPLQHEFQVLNEVSGTLLSQPVQEALAAARDSEQKDKSDINSTVRRETQKRKRPPSPESPQPYRPFEPKSSSSFPEIDQGLPPVRLGTLPGFIREYNGADHAVKMHVYSPSRNRPLACPVVLRCMIRDVVTVFLTLGESATGAPLDVECATAFGPREQEPSHSQSQYLVYQNLSQQIAKMIQSQPQTSLRAVLNLLCSYEELFVQRCAVCDRILSVEAYVPPVGRVWTKMGDGAFGWEARHATCLQR
ncbi:hypothetical protein SCP_0311110 [Sparassis crispa]|uniref:Mediator of RNA polymerase II transcription subunit 27 n=1 Tax=Sparassis crispa TaxID=139825 RepID=A0A401GGU1_9APHY|nr:hypothetical protein SCP_0311110 [Sparassis crispa]GBE81382.1 hypothetical protein SCP_0311110 [Sparassis crispa]